jgi:hypothetical protein
MRGAREYANMFRTGQYGRLYLVSSSHARGKTFHIFVLPAGENATPNGENAPLNKDAVEVYGIINGQPGWTENYGWLHKGRWIEDFDNLCAVRKSEIEAIEEGIQKGLTERDRLAALRKSELLSTY